MAKCPSCGKEISFIRCIIPPHYWKTIGRNMLRGIKAIWKYFQIGWRASFYEISPCPHCGFEYSVEWASTMLFIVMAIIPALFLFIFFLDFLKLGYGLCWLCIIPILLVISNIWWRYIAKLREPYF